MFRDIKMSGDRDRGGQNVPNARGGGELAPKVVLGKLGLLTPKLRIFYRISVEKGQIQGPPKIKNFHPPSNFRRFYPPYPGLQDVPSGPPSGDIWASLNLCVSRKAVVPAGFDLNSAGGSAPPPPPGGAPAAACNPMLIAGCGGAGAPSPCFGVLRSLLLSQSAGT